jgi:hypothetical protein
MKNFLIILLLSTTLFANIGKVTAVRGDVSVQRDTTNLEATRGMIVKQQDMFLTKKLSRAQISLNDKTVITIGPKSKFSFDKYSDDKDKAEAKMKIHHGVFKAITGEIGKIAPHRFKIKTKTSTIGIRGTHFMGIIEDDFEKIACIKGEITVKVMNKTYDIPAGHMITIIKGEVKDMEISKFEYINFRRALFGGTNNTDNELDPRLDNFDVDTLLNDEVSVEVEATHDFIQGPQIIDGEITNPDNGFTQPFDPDIL